MNEKFLTELKQLIGDRKDLLKEVEVVSIERDNLKKLLIEESIERDRLVNLAKMYFDYLDKRIDAYSNLEVTDVNDLLEQFVFDLMDIQNFLKYSIIQVNETV